MLALSKARAASCASVKYLRGLGGVGRGGVGIEVQGLGCRLVGLGGLGGSGHGHGQRGSVAHAVPALEPMTVAMTDLAICCDLWQGGV